MLAGLRRRIALLLVGIAASGCGGGRGGGIPMTALAFDTARVAAVTPGTKRMLVYSVDQERSLWELPEHTGFEARSAA